MPNVASLAAIANATLIRTVDDERPPTGDAFRLPAFLRSLVDAQFATLVETDNATATTESERAGSSQGRRAALDVLETLIRDGYNRLKAIPRSSRPGSTRPANRKRAAR